MVAFHNKKLKLLISLIWFKNLANFIIKTMETVYINSPLGITKIIGDQDGISVISVSDVGTNEISRTIPEVLKEAVLQLQEK